MADNWLERGLAQEGLWHVSDLAIESGPFGQLPVSIRVIALPRDPIRLAEDSRPVPEQLFVPRVIPLILIFAIPGGSAAALNGGAVERFKKRLRLPGVVVEVDGGATDTRSGITIVSGDHGWSSGDGSTLASWVEQVLADRAFSVRQAARSQKPLNTGRVNDLLHSWSRELLSSDLIVNDIDAICFKGRDRPLTLVEIKRSRYVPWQPYRNDASNYALLRALSISADRDVFDITLHYDPKSQEAPFTVTPHFIIGTSSSSEAKTIGFAMEPLLGETTEAATRAVAEFVDSWTGTAYWSDK